MKTEIKHTWPENILHIWMQFVGAWTFMCIPHIYIRAIFAIEINETLSYTLIFLIMLYLYFKYYKKQTLKVHSGWILILVMISTVNVFWYNFVIANLMFYFTKDYDLAGNSNLIYPIFLPIPIITYIAAFKSLKLFSIMAAITVFLFTIATSIFIIID